jgi:hypothetical protein
LLAQHTALVSSAIGGYPQAPAYLLEVGGKTDISRPVPVFGRITEMKPFTTEVKSSINILLT